MNINDSNDIKKNLEKGLEYQHKGQLQKAKVCYELLLEKYPNEADTLHLLGLLEHQLGNTEKSIILIKSAIDNNCDYLYLNNLGQIYCNNNEHQKSIQCYQKAIEVKSDELASYANLASALIQIKEYNQAIDYCHRALKLDPVHQQSLYNLALAYHITQNMQKAINQYELLIKYYPGCHQAYNNLGNIYQNTGLYIDAISCYKQAIQLTSNNADLYYNLALSLRQLDKTSEAIHAFEKSISLNPNLLNAYIGAGKLCQQQSLWEKAYYYLKTAARISPNNASVLSAFTDILLCCAEWNTLESTEKSLKALVQYHLDNNQPIGLTPFVTLHLNVDLAKQHAIAKNTTQHLFSTPIKAFDQYTKANQRLKIGYISPDFNQHSVGLLIKDILALHNQNKYEIFAYDTRNIADTIHHEIKNSIEHFVDISALSYTEAAHKIHDDGINILIDLSGYTGHAKPHILALKPAPIQCFFLGSLGTMGAEYIDYYITTTQISPPETLNHYTEKFLYLPSTYIAVNRFNVPSPIKTKKEYCLPEDKIILCCFNNTRRIDKLTFMTWIEILKKTDNTVLWLQSNNSLFKRNIINFTKQHHIDISRIIITPPEVMTISGHHQHADLYLDTMTITAGTAGIIVLSCHVPLLTCVGNTPQSRQSSSTLKGALLEELICNSKQAYITQAIDLCKNPNKLCKLKTKLKRLNKVSPLFNPKAFSNHLEMGYKLIWENHQSNNQKDIIYISITNNNIKPSNDKDITQHKKRKNKNKQLETMLQEASSFHQNNHLTEAKKIYQSIISKYPQHAQTHYALGILYHQLNKSKKAIKHLKYAIQFDDTIASYHNDLGAIYESTQQIEKAIRCYQHAITINPKYIDAHNNLALIEYKQGDIESSINYLKKTLTFTNQNIVGHYNLGKIYQESKEHDLAIIQYEKVLALAPENIEAHFNLAQIYIYTSYHDKALYHYNVVLKLNPENAYIHTIIGNIYRFKGQYQDSLCAYQQSLKLDPTYKWAHYNLALLYKINSNIKSAIFHFNKTLEIDSEHILSMCHLAELYEKNMSFDKAFATFRQAVQISPKHLFALAHYAYALIRCADWKRLHDIMPNIREAIGQKQPEDCQYGMSKYVAMHMDFDKELLLHIASVNAKQAQNCERIPFNIIKHNPKKLRIGYISPDFRRHPVGLLIQNIFQFHDDNQFEIYAYDISNVHDDINLIIRNSVKHFININQLSFFESAKRIFDDKIDILIDLAGQTGDTRIEILTYKPAPIQAHFLGDCGTVGADYLDYYITHESEVPLQWSKYFTEKLAYLPETRIGTFTFETVNPLPTRQDFNLPESKFIFCCFNGMQRIDAKVFSCWMKILSQAPNSILWLQSDIPQCQYYLHQTAKEHCIDPDRIYCSPVYKMTETGHQCLADLFLDTFVISGGTTSILAMAGGLPVLTRAGDTPPARNGASMVAAANMHEMIVYSTEEYIQRAIELALSPQKLQTIKLKLQKTIQQSPLFNPKRYIKHLELSYMQMWSNYQSGDKDHIIIKPLDGNTIYN